MCQIQTIACNKDQRFLGTSMRTTDIKNFLPDDAFYIAWGGQGYGIVEVMQKAAKWNIPLALGVGATYALYTQLPSMHKSMFYWWVSWKQLVWRVWDRNMGIIFAVAVAVGWLISIFLAKYLAYPLTLTACGTLWPQIVIPGMVFGYANVAEYPSWKFEPLKMGGKHSKSRENQFCTHTTKKPMVLPFKCMNCEIRWLAATVQLQYQKVLCFGVFSQCT